MTQREQYRDNVYVAEGKEADRTRTGAAAREGTPLNDPLPNADRDLFRGPLGRELNADGNRQPPSRDSEHGAGPDSSRPPLLAGTPLPGSASATSSEFQAAKGRGLVGRDASLPDPSSMQRAMSLLKQAAPFVARLLPLVEGNIGAALGNLLAPRAHSPSAPPPDLAPVRNQIAEVQLQQTELRATIQEQTTSLKRVEDHLELVREATDRNTREQQELMDSLKGMGRRVSLIAVGLSVLLVLSVVMNVFLYLYVKHVLP